LADPICTFLFSILVIFTTVPLTRECINVLMEGTPLEVNLINFKEELKKVEGV
jgi:solute carrier family 30 (zinc transporter), member 2